MNTITLIISALLLCSLIFGAIVLRAWSKRRFFKSLVPLLIFLVLVLSALLVLLVSVGTKGYDALVHEQLAATVFVTPLGSQQFSAKIVRPNAADTTFVIAGDELYVDARILKWKPIVNIVGLHTVYQLDRVSGRYTDMQDEQTKLRSLYSLAGKPKAWDLFALRTNYGFLSPLLDAHYGSAAFIPVRNVGVVRILVTTSGLIARPE